MKRRSTLDQFRENLRLQQVYNTFLRYGMDLLFDRGILGDFRRTMQRFIYRPPVPLEPLSMPVKARLMLQELGPTYVKMGQIVSSQAQILPREWESELSKLQASVPPFPQEQVREIIIEELGAPPEDLFETFEPKPLAAASTAQVHRATLSDGQEVVVKVQRPGIYQQVKADLGIMLNAGRVIQRRSAYAREVGLVAVLEEFADNVLLELDYGGEAYNARRLARNLEKIEGVHIPVIYTELSSPRVLTMEFIAGVKATNVVAIEAAGLDRQALAETLLRSLVKQLLVDGFFHGDPHPGNVLVNLETGMITYLDTGMVGELDVSQRMNLIQLLLAVRDRDVKGMAQIMRGLSKPFRKVDEKAYARDFERKVSRYLEPGSGTGFSGAVNVGLDLLRSHGLRLDPQLTLAIKALIQLEVLASTLSPGAAVAHLGFGMTKDLLIEEVTADKVVEVVRQQAVLSLREVAQRLPSLQEATVKWLDQYQKGRLEVRVDTSDLSSDIKAIRGMARQVIIGVILIGMLIGSSIVASVPIVGESIWSTLRQFALIGYTASMILAGILVLGLVWRLWRGGEDE